MTVAPYNPDTLALMRVNAHRGLTAVAAMLGWDHQRTSNVARKHQIELVITASPSVVVVFPSPSIAPDCIIPPPPSPPRPIIVTLPTIITFGKRQASLYEVLVAQSPKFTTGQELGEMVGIPWAHVSSHIHPLAAKLKLAGIVLQSKMGRGNSGYRIMPPADGIFPTLTASREFVLPSPAKGDSSAVNPRLPRNSQG
jgi:biotin operon repressor